MDGKRLKLKMDLRIMWSKCSYTHTCIEGVYSYKITLSVFSSLWLKHDETMYFKGFFGKKWKNKQKKSPFFKRIFFILFLVSVCSRRIWIMLEICYHFTFHGKILNFILFLPRSIRFSSFHTHFRTEWSHEHDGSPIVQAVH